MGQGENREQVNGFKSKDIILDYNREEKAFIWEKKKKTAAQETDSSSRLNCVPQR